MIIRPATADDAASVARVWHEGWHDGHAANVPDELTAVRTRAYFDEHAARRIGETTVAEVAGDVAGFVMVVDDEVDQVYVDGAHRGTDVARTLLAAAEQQVADNGHDEAFLIVVPGNARARRFYEREGWRDAGLGEHPAPAPGGAIPVRAHRYVKAVGGERSMP